MTAVVSVFAGRKNAWFQFYLIRFDLFRFDSIQVTAVNGVDVDVDVEDSTRRRQLGQLWDGSEHRALQDGASSSSPEVIFFSLFLCFFLFNY